MRHRVLMPVLVLAVLVTGVAAAPAQAIAPTPTAVPALTGTPREGQSLSSSQGTFSGTTPMSFTRTWVRCDADGETNCATIAGQAGTTYTLTADDVDRVVKVTVTATNVDGSASATSAPSPVIVARAVPQNTVAPTLSGPAIDRQTLTAENGTWTGTLPITHGYRWYRCDADGAMCAPISAQTKQTYTLTSADVGATVKAEVTAVNADGTGFAYTAASAVVAPAAPENTKVPTLTGTAREGQTLTSSNEGTWTGTPDIVHVRSWLRCDLAGINCAEIPGATAKTYVLAAADVGSTVRAAVTAHNAAGSALATSAPSAPVTERLPPANTAAPTVSGSAVDTQTLTGANGTWTGTASITFKNRWLRCDAAGADCTAISGATKTTYVLTSADVGARLRFEVTATNPDGVTVLESAPSDVVEDSPPESIGAPAVTGSAREGQVLSVSTGTWRGTAPMTYTYQWYRCDGADCAPIDGATDTTYRLTADERGRNVRAVVEASNDSGAAQGWSNITSVVAAGAPVNTELPQIAGDLARDGTEWSGTLGTWAGTEPFTQGRQWLRCSATGTACAVISGAVAPTYRLTAADVGRTVRLRVHTSNSQGNVTADSAPSPVIGAAPPTADAPGPVVAGDPIDGRTLSITGTWSGTAPIALTHAWERCDAVTLTCAAIPGATATTYTLTPADVGARVRVRIGASNSAGGALVFTDPTTIVQSEAPRSTVAPVLTGTARELETLTAGAGTFTGTAPLTRTYQWESCDDRGLDCADLPGATAAQLTLTSAHRGRTLRARVTATNSAGSATATTPLSTVVTLAPPASTVAPSVSPNTDLKDGRLLVASAGGWTGSDPMTLTYRWERCSAVGDKCAAIPGAAESTYRLVTSDVGFTVRVVVTAANGGGAASQASPVTGVVLTNPPHNDIAPTITTPAAVEDGAMLQAHTGTWSGLVPFTTSYRWWRCGAGGDDCSVIPDATASVYTLGPADVGLTVRAEVTQANLGGSTAAMSDPTAVVLAAPPRNVLLPRVDGGAAVGRTVSADRGTWSGTPELLFTYQWQRCETDGSACADIPGAIGSTYRLLAADDTKTVRVVVTATNDEGADTAVSPTTAEVSDDPPVAAVAPTLVHPALVAQGSVLTVDRGTWAGADPKTYAYQWRRCDALTGATCVDIPGATAVAYGLTKDDVGKRLVAHVTVENVVAISTAETSPSPVVLPEPPSIQAPPMITATGGVRDGVRLSASQGTWKGATPMTFDTIWLRCDADGAACAPIPAATGATYTPGSADVGHRLRARVSARNAATTVTQDSDATAVVAATLPANTTRPAAVILDGKPRVGGRLRAGLGLWAGTAPMDLGLQWQRCVGTSLAACDDIPGATTSEYTLREDDVGRRLRVVVRARNAAGTVQAESTPTTAVPATPPVNTALPTVSGGPVREGAELQASPGSWTGSAPLVVDYQWERCASAGAPTCPRISGATRPSYTLTSTDVGKFVRVSVTASNAGGRATASSAGPEEVGGIPPVSTAPPAVTARGGIKVNGSLSATPGKWGGTAPMKFTTRWQRCDARGVTCTDIPGAEKPTYKLVADDVDGTELKAPIRAVVTATNVAGDAEAPTSALGAVAAAGTGVVGAGGTKKKRATAAKKLPKSKSLATVRRLRIKKGRLRVTLVCPKSSRDRCGVIGSVAVGHFSQGISVNGIAKGKRVTRAFKLTRKQRRALKRTQRGRRRARVLVRLSAPATPTRPRVRRVRMRVPRPLRGRRRGAARTTTTPKATQPAEPTTAP